MQTEAPLLDVRDLAKRFQMDGGWGRARRELRAVDGISFQVRRGQTLALVGESGCGKSTVANLVMQLLPPSEGEVRVAGEAVDARSSAALRRVWRQMQMVFQDPAASLHPRMRALDIVAEPLRNYGLGDRAGRERQARELLERVGLPVAMQSRYPHEFSGGQKQRLGIARALALSPALIVADEPVSALDVSVQAQVLNLLRDLQRERGLAYLFVSHDLGVVEYIADEVAVMYLGVIVERAPRQAFFARPLHPYAEALLASVPAIDPRRRRQHVLLEGDVPSAAALPGGCRFRTRCPLAHARCAAEEPALREIEPAHFVACHAVAGSPASDSTAPQP
ncbi:ABC transporter ATP-binding protein [Variovorax sp. KK3]|uniref:ABC transporter ATP-binding protein n=1 Tax=Variovorax sp. KK3 TaxID=1855728 RepID=UPI00097C0213|nr:oligopeptide/dipeptide ABC transporter ATP-binding protein [Variovorax sp. KK3]